MKTTVQRWGNSLAVRIPSAFAKEIGIGDNAPVEITVRNGSVVLEPIREDDGEEPLTLDDLLDGMTEANLHEEVDWGPPRGREVW